MLTLLTELLSGPSSYVQTQVVSQILCVLMTDESFYFRSSKQRENLNNEPPDQWVLILHEPPLFKAGR